MTTSTADISTACIAARGLSLPRAAAETTDMHTNMRARTTSREPHRILRGIWLRWRLFRDLPKLAAKALLSRELMRELERIKQERAQEAAKRERALELREEDATSLVGAAGDEPVNSLDDLPASAPPP